MNFQAPEIDYAGISPLIALTAGLVLILVTAVFSGRHQRLAVSIVSLATLGVTAGLCIWQLGEAKDLVAGALRMDDLAMIASLICIACAAFVIPLSWREE